MWWLIFLAGIVLGMLLMFLLAWASYSTRTIVFTNCPREKPYCMDDDYINDPREATDKGYSNTLFVANDKLYFERPKRGNCVHHLDRPMHIRHPQYCLVNNEEYRHMEGDSYIHANGTVVYLGENCGNGLPLPKWD